MSVTAFPDCEAALTAKAPTPLQLTAQLATFVAELEFISMLKVAVTVVGMFVTEVDAGVNETDAVAEVVVLCFVVAASWPKTALGAWFSFSLQAAVPTLIETRSAQDPQIRMICRMLLVFATQGETP